MIANSGKLDGYTGAVETETANPLSYLTKEVDYLIPAAVEMSINKNNAD